MIGKTVRIFFIVGVMIFAVSGVALADVQLEHAVDATPIQSTNQQAADPEPVSPELRERILHWRGYRIDHRKIRPEGDPADPYHRLDIYQTTGRIEIEMWAQQSPPRFHEIQRTSDGRIIHERLDVGDEVLLYGVGVISKQPTLRITNEDGVIFWPGMPMADSLIMYREDLLPSGRDLEQGEFLDDPRIIHEIGAPSAGSGSHRSFGESGHLYVEYWVHEGQMMEETYFPELPRVWEGDDVPFVMLSEEDPIEARNMARNNGQVLGDSMGLGGDPPDIPFDLWLPSDKKPSELSYQPSQQITDEGDFSIFENLEQVFRRVDYSGATFFDRSTDQWLLIRQSPAEQIVPLLRRMLPSWIKSVPMEVPVSGAERTAWFQYHNDDGMKFGAPSNRLFIEIDDQFLFIVGTNYSEEQLLELLREFELADSN